MAFCGRQSRRHMPSICSLASSAVFTLLILPCLLLVLTFPAPASAIGSAVIGIDVGTEYLKAALVKPGIPLEIVLTKDSKRKEAAAVAFKPTGESNAPFPERFYGGDALSLAARFPDDVYSNLKLLLGVPFDGGDNEIVKMYKARYPSLSLETAPGGRGGVGLRTNRLGTAEKKDAFLVEELLAMQLKQVKANADAMAGKGSDIRDAVITYPSFYTAQEKRSLELAAELAGLKVDALVSDGLAVGLNYATSRTFPVVSEGQKPQYHAVYDMGAGSTTASVLRFQDRVVPYVGRLNKTIHEVQVLGSGWDRTLGGDLLNEIIVNDMVNTLAEDKKLKDRVPPAQIKAHGRTMAKLWKEAERLRQILSANTETSSGIEGLYEEDVNFKYKITRSQFEKLAHDAAARVAKPLEQALAASGVNLGDVDSVILHGGAIRTPFVQRELEKACSTPGKLRTNVNADEAAVFGASFKGAALSPSFRVKDIRAGDEAFYPVLLKWTSDGKPRSQKLFTATSQVGPEKQVTFKNKEDFEVEFHQQISSSDGSITESPVLSVETKNLTASVGKLKDKFGCAPANVTTKFAIRLSPIDGLPEVANAWIGCEVDSGDKKGGGVVEDVKDFFGFGSKKDEQAPLGEGVGSSESSTMVSTTVEESTATKTATTTTPTASSSTASSGDVSATAKSDEKSAPKAKHETIPIALTAKPLGTPALASSELRRIETRLAAFDASDRDRVLREEALNELESFIYRSRDWFEDADFAKVLKADKLALLKERIEAASEWLYGDGPQAKTADFRAKLKSLKEIVKPALRRKNEHAERPARLQELQSKLGSARTVSEIIQRQIKDDEDRFSSAVSASTSTADSSTSASGGTSTESASMSSPGSDPLNDLDDDPYAASSSTATTSAATPKPTAPEYSIFEPRDLASLTGVYETVRTWLDSQLAAQEKLSESDDPSLTVAELGLRTQQLDKVLNLVYERLSSGKRPAGFSEQPKKKSSSSRKEKEKAKGERQGKQPPKGKTPPKDEL